jgi:hypothetical protein
MYGRLLASFFGVTLDVRTGFAFKKQARNGYDDGTILSKAFF